MAAQLGLPAALRARGLTVEVVPGWETRSAGSFAPHAALCHWTAGPANSKTRPSLNIVTNGRSDLPGPLCNVYLDRNGVAVVVSANRANHGGAGVWRGVTGNSSFFGTEAEAAGPTDFTDAQRWAYPRVNAAYCDLGKFGAEMIAGHSEYATPAGRKVDINSYPMTAMRSQVAALLAGQDDDMPLNDADKTWIKDALRSEIIDRFVSNDGAGHDLQLWQLLNLLKDRQVGYGNRIEHTEAEVVALRAAVTALAGGAGVTPQQVEDAVAKALRDNIVKVNVDVSPGA